MAPLDELADIAEPNLSVVKKQVSLGGGGARLQGVVAHGLVDAPRARPRHLSCVQGLGLRIERFGLGLRFERFSLGPRFERFGLAPPAHARRIKSL